MSNKDTLPPCGWPQMLKLFFESSATLIQQAQAAEVNEHNYEHLLSAVQRVTEYGRQGLTALADQAASAAQAPQQADKQRLDDYATEICRLRNVIQSACIGGTDAMIERWVALFPDAPVPTVKALPDAFPALQALTEAIMTRADADHIQRRMDEAVSIMATRGWSPPIPWPAAAPLPLLVQAEPRFLLNKARFKIMGSEYGCGINGLPDALNGRWVALVAADDDCHLLPAPAAQEPLHPTVLVDWLAARYRAAGGKEGITDLSVFCEEVMRWTEQKHGITGAAK